MFVTVFTTINDLQKDLWLDYGVKNVINAISNIVVFLKFCDWKYLLSSAGLASIVGYGIMWQYIY